MSNGDRLLERVCSGANGVTANELLAELYRGYPVENLRRALWSANPAVVKTAVWIVSELGELGRPLVRDIVALLDNSSRYVRFYAIDSILSMAGGDNGESIAKAIERIDDGDDVVRRKAVRFLSRAPSAQLAAAQDHISQGALKHLVDWLLHSTLNIDVDDVIAHLGHPNARDRLFGVAAAVRISSFSLEPLRSAAMAADADLRRIARDELQDRESDMN